MGGRCHYSRSIGEENEDEKAPLAQAHSGLKILISLVPKSLLAPLGKSVDI